MAAAAIPVSAVEKPASPWLRGPAWDSVWMLSALWLAPLVYWLSRGNDPRPTRLDMLYLVFSAGLWLAHRFGSFWVTYLTTAYRPLVRDERKRFVLIPLVIFAVTFAVILPKDGTLPWTRAQRVMGLVILDYLLVTYHFASQHFGALSLYRVRAGKSGGQWLRRMDRIYALAIGGALVIVAEIVAGTVFFIDVWIDPWLAPAWVAENAETIRTTGTVIIAGATLVMLALEAFSARRSLPRAAYVLGLGAMTAAAFQARTPFVFIVLWSSQHWIVATGLTLLIAQGEPAPEGRGWRGALHGIHRRPWAFLLVLAVVSAGLLPFFEVEAVDAKEMPYAERIFGSFAAALRTSAWVPLLVALGMATSFLHYWLDRSVYRMSDPRVREAARGLFVSTASVPARIEAPVERRPAAVGAGSA